MKHVVIVGNGIAGVTCAIKLRENTADKITIISAESEYFFSRTALMYVFMGHMKFSHLYPYEKDFWAKNNIELVFNEVIEVKPEVNLLLLKNNEQINYDQLILATGSKPNKFGWKNQNASGVVSLYHKQDLETIENLSNTCEEAVIIGGGLIGIELAEMLHSRKIKVTMLVREAAFWNNILPIENSELINRHILEHKINLKVNTTLKEILVDEQGKAIGIVTDKNEVINGTLVGLTVGVSPNIDFIKNTTIETDKGVLVDRFLQTNVTNIYAIGDCAQQRNQIDKRPAVEAVWYTGRIMGEALSNTLVGEKTEYKPGMWFNSAKFLDIEYQTYGWVSANESDFESHFNWLNKKDNKALTISFNKSNRRFLGINTFGIRMRQAFFEDVIYKNESINFVINNLEKANFDPEFFEKYENEIKSTFNKNI